MSEGIEFTHSELSTSFGLFRTGPGRLKICNTAVGERVDENWLLEEFEHAERELAEFDVTVVQQEVNQLARYLKLNYLDSLH